ncbi:MAG: hypothetical protein JNK78_12950 [Planctomycetes bacterium]|nr:hypothetical protein [Planctomycetota bacterium]
MAAAIRHALPDVHVDKLPGGRGDFLVKVDGRVVWDKRGREQRFPEHDEILAALRGP